MIKCAAIKLIKDDKELVMTGFRHPLIYEAIDFLGYSVKDFSSIEEGFIDHRQKFYNRYDAFDHAMMCGQLSNATIEYKESMYESQLYSEDIY